MLKQQETEPIGQRCASLALSGEHVRRWSRPVVREKANGDWYQFHTRGTSRVHRHAMADAEVIEGPRLNLDGTVGFT